MIFTQLFKSKLWLFPLAYVLFYLIEAIFDVFYEHGAFYIYILIVFLSFFVLFILATIKSFKSETETHWLAVVSAFVLVFFWQDIRMQTSLLMQGIKIMLRPQIFSECIKNAIPISDGGVIGICDRKSYDLWHAVVTEAIVYDSADQIVKDRTHRSTTWSRAAHRLFQENAHDMGYKATKLFGHYYYVYFSTDLPSDLRVSKSVQDTARNSKAP